MCLFYLILGLVISSVIGGNISNLPSWISENSAFKNPTVKDSIKTGNGSVHTKEEGNHGWVIHLNEKEGHGIEVKLETLSLNPNLNEFLLISAWPMSAEFTRIQLFTGKHNRTLKTLRIPNTKSFFTLYSTSKTTSSPELSLKYRRYGISFEVHQPPTDSPVKKKETVFEIQLKGKPPDVYFTNFSLQLKDALRKIARRYCNANKLPFNESILTEEMVLIHRVSPCPYEWPDRNICASLQHSIFVSGERFEDIILDYQLIADHLRIMWSEVSFPELEELGLTVYQLPPTNNVVFYWTIIIALMVTSSFIATCICWKVHDPGIIRARENSTASEATQKTKKPKLRLAKHQRIPSFMCANPTDTQTKNSKDSFNLKTPLKENFEDFIKPEDSSGLPIKNYFGSILFSSNRAFEDDEDNSNELKPKQTTNPIT